MKRASNIAVVPLPYRVIEPGGCVLGRIGLQARVLPSASAQCKGCRHGGAPIGGKFQSSPSTMAWCNDGTTLLERQIAEFQSSPSTTAWCNRSKP